MRDAAQPPAAMAPGRYQEDQHEEELFPHKSYSDERKRCRTCVRSLPVQGYRALHQQLTRSKTRCGRSVVVLIYLAKYPFYSEYRCVAAVCSEHSLICCDRCSTTLGVKKADISV